MPTNITNDSRDGIRILVASTTEQIEVAKNLIMKYSATLGINLDFQDFDSEMSGFPGMYSPPGGAILLSSYGKIPVGCVAIRQFQNDICEMKRLYVTPEYRGLSIGLALARCAISTAKEMGYRVMRLDTLPGMTAAQSMYKQLGFRDIPPYRGNPIEGSRFLELDLLDWHEM